MSKIPCPLCGPSGEMQYRKIPNPAGEGEKFTHAWICNECPAVLFEYHAKADTDAVGHYLEEGCVDMYSSMEGEVFSEFPFRFLTNACGEEVSDEQLFQVVKDEGDSSKVEPLPHFKKEALWWEQISGDWESAYVVSNKGHRGVLFTQEFVYTDAPGEDDRALAKEEGMGDCQEVLDELQKRAARIAEAFPFCDVLIGNQTGILERHEICVFIPYGTLGKNLIAEISRLACGEEITMALA